MKLHTQFILFMTGSVLATSLAVTASFLGMVPGMGIKQSFTVGGGMTLVVLAVILPLGYYVARRRMTKPILKLADFAQTFSKSEIGDFAKTILAGDFAKTLQSTRKDEIGSLYLAFHEMMLAFREIIDQIQQSGIKVSSSASELAATAKQQEVTMKTQVESTNKVLQSVEEIAGVTDNLIHTMKGVAFTSEDATEMMDRQQSDLARMAEAMQHMEEASKTISGRLQTINEKADNITNIVTTITKVADQTNLLSLNAAIEAEKAGEFGRGFTVVAREIRRLADQTAFATLDIDQMVKEMQSAVSTGVMEMDKFINEVRQSAEDVTRVSAKLFQIIKQVQALAPRFEEVNLEMVNLSEGMKQALESLHETYLAIGQLDEAARGLQEKVSRFEVRKGKRPD